MRWKRLCTLLLSLTTQMTLAVFFTVSASARLAQEGGGHDQDGQEKSEADHKDEKGDKSHHGGEGHEMQPRATGEAEEGHPAGSAGKSRVEVEDADDDGRGVPKPDRWRYGFPEDTRHEHGRGRDPYHQNVLKGDYPIKGNSLFLTMTLSSDTVTVGRRVPSPSNFSAARPGSRDFFGRGEQFFNTTQWRASFSLFKGDTVFTPVDWEIKVTPTFNINYLHTEELGIVNIDVREGRTRFDGRGFSLQEAYFEKKLSDNPRLFPFIGRKGDGRSSPAYDFSSVRAGIQRFTSDFRGFIFSDEEPGVRLFGTMGRNQYQYNVAWFYMLEKDTNSGLNTFKSRHQNVYIANLIKQDFLFKGWNAAVSVHYNNDRAGQNDNEFGGNFKFNENGFLVRPAAIGDATPHSLNVAYLGTSSDGHIGRINVSHAFYWALGHDSHDPIAGRPVHVNAQMAGLELSVDRDWIRPKATFFWSSGDKFPRDSVARGFDSIFDNVNFAGGGGGFLVNPTNTQQDRVLINPLPPPAISFWNRESIRLTSTNVALQQPGSLVPSLRSSKEQGQASYVNPGIYIYSAGADAKLTPKLLGTINFSYLRFHRTEPLQLALFQNTIRNEIGFDYSFGAQYRPYLNEQFIVLGAFSVLVPGQGLKDIYTSPTIYSGFVAVKFVY